MARTKTNARKAARKVDAIVVLSTIGDASAARRIAATLVEERLAACVNVTGALESTYRWQGAVTTETEYLMVIKTRAALYQALERRLKALHPYAVPEIIAVELCAGAKSYLKWLSESTQDERRRKGAQPVAKSGPAP